MFTFIQPLFSSTPDESKHIALGSLMVYLDLDFCGLFLAINVKYNDDIL